MVYRRGDIREKRQRLMTAWTAFRASPRRRKKGQRAVDESIAAGLWRKREKAI